MTQKLRNWVSLIIFPRKKPGFCDNFGLLTEIWVRNPVSDPPTPAPRNRVSETVFASSPRFGQETRFLNPPRDTASAKKPGFYHNLGIPTEIWVSNPVSESPTRNRPRNSKKPGFCDSFGIPTEIWVSNPVSESPTRYGLALSQETGFLRQFWHHHRDLGKKPGFWVPHAIRPNPKPRNRVSTTIWASQQRFG